MKQKNTSSLFYYMVILFFLLAGPAFSDVTAGEFASQSCEPQAKCWARYSNSEESKNARVLIETAFRVPCPEQINKSFLQTLQRALAARDYYSGPVSGLVDPETSMAVRNYQKDNGFDSPILSLKTAQDLGLLAITGNFDHCRF